VNVTATPTGTRLVDQAPSPLQEGLANALNDLAEIERATIALSLQRIVDLMEAGAVEAAPVLETGQLAPDKTDELTSSEDEKSEQTDKGAD
jgi:hypothetical protein